MTNIHRLIYFLALVVLILVIPGCAPTPQPTPTLKVTIVATPTSTTTWTAVPTSTPTATSTALPSATNTRTATPRPTSTRAPTPTYTPFAITVVRPTVARTVAPSRTPFANATATPALPLLPSQVSTLRSGDKFTLIVNGKTIYVKGMNYNVNYTNLSEDVQLKMHRRDFQIMRDAGVNAIVGWGIYDDTTLNVAQEYGIGVIMPFDLDPQGAYDNQDYRNQVLSDFRDYVNKYKNFPAVWGWNPGGDELLYRMKSEENRTPDKMQNAADLELEMVAMAHTLDPNHIIVLKEPRDWYIKYLIAATQKRKNDPGYQNLTTTLVYGVNVYGHTDDIQLALNNAKLTLTNQLGIGMLVTEFGPFNSQRAERAIDYAAIWDALAQISTLGGMVYVFGPDQPNLAVPNPYDPLTLLPSEYSLLDMNGKPIDDSLANLTARWKAMPLDQ